MGNRTSQTHSHRLSPTLPTEVSLFTIQAADLTFLKREVAMKVLKKFGNGILSIALIGGER